MATGDRRRIASALLGLLVALVAGVVLWPRAPDAGNGERSPASTAAADRDATLPAVPPQAPAGGATTPPARPAHPADPAPKVGSVSGRVVEDPSGAVVPGARVRLWESAPTLKPGRSETADARGEFAFADVSDARAMTLVAEASGRVARLVELPVGAARGGLTVALPTGGVLEGDVLDAKGDALPGVEVAVLEVGEPLPPRRLPHQWFVFDAEIEQTNAAHPRATTDARGHYEARGVPLRRAVTAVVQRTTRLEARSGVVTLTRPEERARRDVRLREPGELLVRFPQPPAEGARPPQVDVHGEVIWLTAEAEDHREDGTCLVAGLTPGPYRVRVWLPGAPDQGQDVTIEPGRRTEMAVTVPAGAAVEGVVIDEEGRGLADATVWWLGGDQLITSTGSDGRFRFEGIREAAGSVRVDAPFGFHHAGLVGTRIEGVTPGRELLRVVLRRSPVLVGRIAGVAPGDRLRSQLLSKTMGGGGDLTLDEHGHFELETGETGAPQLLVVERAGFAPLIAPIPPLEPGVRHDLGDLAFSKGRTVTGVVRGENGDPIAGATILVAEKWSDASQVTRPDGTYRFEHIPDRATQIRVNAQGYPVHINVLPAGVSDTTFDFALDKGGLLELRVVDAEGRPAPEAGVVFAPDGDHPYDVDFDKDGRDRPTNAEGALEARLQARGHFVRAHSSDGKKHGEIESLRIVKGQTTRAEIRLR